MKSYAMHLTDFQECSSLALNLFNFSSVTSYHYHLFNSVSEDIIYVNLKMNVNFLQVWQTCVQNDGKCFQHLL